MLLSIYLNNNHNLNCNIINFWKIIVVSTAFPFAFSGIWSKSQTWCEIIAAVEFPFPSCDWNIVNQMENLIIRMKTGKQTQAMKTLLKMLTLLLIFDLNRHTLFITIPLFLHLTNKRSHICLTPIEINFECYTRIAYSAIITFNREPSDI